MIRFYDKTDNKYFEFVYIDVEKLKLNKNIVFITDETTINQIDGVDSFLKRFIQIDNNKVVIDYNGLKNDILIQLKLYREDAFKCLDSQFFQLNEKILLESDATVVSTLKEELRNVVNLKNQWRNLESHKEFDKLSSIKSYMEIINAIRKDIDPNYNDNETVNTTTINLE